MSNQTADITAVAAPTVAVVALDPQKGLTIKEAADLWGCCERTIRREIAAGRMVAYRITPNGGLRVTRAELDRAREAQKPNNSGVAVNTVGLPVAEAARLLTISKRRAA